jgi:hypothetical protein
MKIQLSYLLLYLFGSVCLGVHASDTVDSFVVRYEQAKTEVQKRTVCIELIDSGFLYLGASVNDVKKVFKNDYEDMGKDEPGYRSGLVHFVPPKRFSNPLESGIRTGWFLSVKYRESDGAIVHYFLTNESIETSTRLKYERKKREGKQDEDPGLPPVELPKKTNSEQEKGTGP